MSVSLLTQGKVRVNIQFNIFKIGKKEHRSIMISWHCVKLPSVLFTS